MQKKRNCSTDDFLVGLSRVVLVSIGLATLPALAEERTVRQSLEVSLESLDPAYASTSPSLTLVQNLFEGLVTYDREGQVEAGQAEKWTLSEDGRVYTFTLRKGLLWSDRQPITAQDFVLGFQRAIDPALDRLPKQSQILAPIENAQAIATGEASVDRLGVRAIDSRTLEIRLKAPTVHFLELLAYPGSVPVPSHVVAQHGEDWSKAEQIVSNGAFILAEKTPNRYILKTNVLYHRGPPSIDRLELIVYADQNAILRGVLEEDLDLATQIRAEQAAWLKRGLPNKHLRRVESPGTVYLAFNTNLERLQDPKLRRALSIATDRELLVRRLGISQNAVAYTFSYLDREAAREFDPPWSSASSARRIEIARSLMREAGYGPKNPLKLTISIVPAYEIDRVATALRSMWRQVWVEVEIAELSGPALVKGKYKNKVEASLSHWYADFRDPLAFLSLLSKVSTKNPARWSHEGYERLLLEMSAEQKPSRRRELHQGLERLLAEEAPIVPLYRPSSHFIFSERLQDAQPVLGIFIGRHLSLVEPVLETR